MAASLGKQAQDQILSWAGKDGAFKRLDSVFRSKTLVPVAGRYHLYVSLACPWAHRCVTVPKLKGLSGESDLFLISLTFFQLLNRTRGRFELDGGAQTDASLDDGTDFIDVSVVHPHMNSLGWSFYPPMRGANNEYLPAELDKVGDYDNIEGVTKDALYQHKFIRELYFQANKNYEGR